MYQLKATSGYEVQVIGSGEKGLCRVADVNYKVVKTGTYDECVKWLADRGVQMLATGSSTR